MTSFIASSSWARVASHTLTRPDVYNTIMAIPGYSHELERELGVDKSPCRSLRRLSIVGFTRSHAEVSRPVELMPST
jgi:hypothetical protein